jgi:hypothetical protein
MDVVVSTSTEVIVPVAKLCHGLSRLQAPINSPCHKESCATPDIFVKPFFSTEPLREGSDCKDPIQAVVQFIVKTNWYNISFHSELALQFLNNYEIWNV